MVVMQEDEQRQVYCEIGAGRLLDIVVLVDGKNVYEGMIEDAPEDIKKLKYSKIDIGRKITYYVYSDLQ